MDLYSNDSVLSFDDISLVPQSSDIKSRDDICLSTSLGEKIQLEIPFISAPMDSVTEALMGSEITRLGGLGVIHRYEAAEVRCNWLRTALSNIEKKVIGAAIGISEEEAHAAERLILTSLAHGVETPVICIDVAHADHFKVFRFAEKLKSQWDKKIHLMIGNIATPSAYNNLYNCGADSVKVGVGSGSACSTRVQTGHGMPTLQSVMNIIRERTCKDGPSIIADGGFKTSGDIVKGLASGADAIMLGSLLSATTESPGQLKFKGTEKFKVYRGMASRSAKISWRGTDRYIEGEEKLIPFKGPVEDVVLDLLAGVRSGFSYSGAKDIKSLQSKAKYVIQSSLGFGEGKPHILDK